MSLDQGWLFEDCNGTISAGDMCGRCSHCEAKLAQAYEGNGSDWLFVTHTSDLTVIRFTEAQKNYIEANGYMPLTPSASAHLVTQLGNRGN